MRTVSFALAILAGLPAWAQQVAFQDTQAVSTHTEQATFSETIVSALSASDQHTTFIKLLQRSKCVPLLAHINTSTVFAPTDQAWAEWAEKHRPDGKDQLAHGWLSSSGLEPWISNEAGDEEAEAFDNQNWALRQHLLYHMLNYTLTPEALLAGDGTNITTETTLLFPLAEEPEHTPLPPPGPPWLPRGGEGMLSGHGQRLRLARSGSEAGGERGRVGVDWMGQEGIAIWDGSGWKESGNGTLTGLKNKGDKGRKHPSGDGDGAPDVNVTGVRWVRNGVVIGVEGVLEPPPSIEEVIRTHPALAYLSQLLPSNTPDPLPSNLSTAPHLTIFAPSNDAIQQAFDDVEKRYLESDYGVEAIGRIMAGGVIVGVGKREQVGWRDTWGKQGVTGSVSGQGLCIKAPSNGSLIVNGTEAQAVDIFASNGVVHIMPNLLVPQDFTLLNSAEKVLLSLNATRFVSLLRTANLSATYAGEPGKDGKAEQPWTILAPSDEMLEMVDRWGGPHGSPPLPVHELWRTAEAQAKLGPDEVAVAAEPMKDATPLQALLQYHILPGRLMPGDIEDGMLVGTELRTSLLAGGRQRMRIDVADRLDGGAVDTIGLGDIRFGGATALGSPTKFGKSAIYIVSNLISPPDDVLQVAVSDLQLSTFIAAVYAAELDHAFKKNPGTTYFVPRNRAFGSLGLVMNYLLLAEGKDELRKLLRYHAVDRVIYSGDAEVGKQVYKTLEGGEIVFKKTKGRNSTLSLQSPTRWENHDSGEALPANGELRPARITHHDALTSTGTIHTIDSVVMPADLRITISKLIRGSKQTTMAELMDKAGLSWVLEGREPSRDEIHHAGLHGIVRSGDDTEGMPVPDLDSLALPSYTVLCPTDKAFSRLNLTHYLNNEEELINLLKLHIIPTQPSTPKTGSSKEPASPPSDGRPLALDDDLIYSTLLSSKTKYGELAFRATGDNSFIVGIRNARAGIGHASARIGSSGRASVRWKRGQSNAVSGGDDKKSFEDDSRELWRGGMTLGGGVLMIDSVLVPYEPSWFSRWGWLVLTLVGIGVIVLIAVVSVGWWWMTRDKRGEYESLEGEDDDS